MPPVTPPTRPPTKAPIPPRVTAPSSPHTEARVTPSDTPPIFRAATLPITPPAKPAISSAAKPTDAPPPGTPADRRPPRFPPAAFPPSRAKLFAATPPAVFLPILGLLALGLALRKACAVTGLPGDVVEAALGALVGGWSFAVLAITVKLIRRPSVLWQDLRPLPGRAGLAAASLSGMAVSGVLAPHAPGLAAYVLVGSVLTHVGLALALSRLLGRDIGGKMIEPTWHLSFGGFIVAAPVLVQLGWTGPARAVFAASLITALLIWLVSAIQLVHSIPPAPQRPLLTLHLAAAALLATTASLIGHPQLAEAMLALGAVILLALVGSARWLLAAGFTPLWGVMGLPLAAFATALLTADGAALWPGLIATIAAVGLATAVAFQVLRLWPGGILASRTNAAEA